MKLSKPNTVASLAIFSMVDIFGITLLSFASRAQSFHESLPLVAMEAKSSVKREEQKPILVESVARGQWKISGKNMDLETLVNQLSQTPAEQKILVSLECDSEGRGSVVELLQLTHRAQQAGISNRLFVLTRGDDRSIPSSNTTKPSVDLTLSRTRG